MRSLLNEGSADRAIRVVLGLVLLTLAITGPKWVWGYIGLLPLFTGIVGWCPAYSVFGFSTCAKSVK